jgi:hypothetical protein
MPIATSYDDSTCKSPTLTNNGQIKSSYNNKRQSRNLIHLFPSTSLNNRTKPEVHKHIAKKIRELLYPEHSKFACKNPFIIETVVRQNKGQHQVSHAGQLKF